MAEERLEVVGLEGGGGQSLRPVIASRMPRPIMTSPPVPLRKVSERGEPRSHDRTALAIIVQVLSHTSAIDTARRPRTTIWTAASPVPFTNWGRMAAECNCGPDEELMEVAGVQGGGLRRQLASDLQLFG